MLSYFERDPKETRKRAERYLKEAGWIKFKQQALRGGSFFIWLEDRVHIKLCRFASCTSYDF